MKHKVETLKMMKQAMNKPATKKEISVSRIGGIPTTILTWQQNLRQIQAVEVFLCLLRVLDLIMNPPKYDILKKLDTLDTLMRRLCVRNTILGGV
jgi:hypothetical protein